MIKALRDICGAYVCLSVMAAGWSLWHGDGTLSALNALYMLVWCAIAVGVLSLHRYLSRWSPVAMVVVQYLAALVLIFATVWSSQLFTTLHPDAYRDAFVSFTVPYGVGAAIYYIDIYRSAKRQDALLKQIRAKRETP